MKASTAKIYALPGHLSTQIGHAPVRWWILTAECCPVPRQFPGATRQWSGVRLQFFAEPLQFPGEKLQFPGEKLQWFGGELPWPGVRLQFLGGELQFPGEKLQFPGEKLQFPVEELQFPVEELQFLVEELQFPEEKLQWFGGKLRWPAVHAGAVDRIRTPARRSSAPWCGRVPPHRDEALSGRASPELRGIPVFFYNHTPRTGGPDAGMTRDYGDGEGNEHEAIEV